MMKRQNIRTLALIVVTFTYLLVGAVIFDMIESNHAVQMRQELEYKERAWKVLYNITEADYENITELILQTKPYKAGGNQWSFVNAFYFSTTLITTIGYGHSTPKTLTGKLACMLYSLIGIPLCIVMFQSIGERLNALITFLLRSLKHLFRCKNGEVSQMNLIVVSMNICTLVLAAGAALFSHYEKWSYLDSVYYCFITLTTVGFGDMVAMQKSDPIKTDPDYVLFSLLFIMAGLTVVSSAMNLLVLRFLTMNTEDVRREELEQAAAAREAIRLEGDVITVNGSLLLSQQQQQQQQQQQEHYPDQDEAGFVDEEAETDTIGAAFRDPTTVATTYHSSVRRSCCHRLLGGCCFGFGSRSAASRRHHRGRSKKLLSSGRGLFGAGAAAGHSASSKLQQPHQHYTIARAPGKIQHLLFPQHSSFRRSNNTVLTQLPCQPHQPAQRSQQTAVAHPASVVSCMSKRASI